MREHYLAWYDQIFSQLKVMEELEIASLSKMPRSIIISGMGGSGIVGDLYQTVTSDRLNIPVVVIKDYKLPKWVSSKDLAVAVSYSGNTLETIECFKHALKVNAKLLAISSGGVLEKLALENNILYVKVVKGLVPRASLPSMFTALAISLNKLLNSEIVTRDELNEAMKLLKQGVKDDFVIKIADHIENTLPVIVTCVKYAPLAIRFKNELNENSKIPAKVEVVPEWGHNDIVGWEKPYFKNFSVVILREPMGGDTKCSAILDYVDKYFKNSGIRTINIEMKGKSITAQILYGSLLAGLVSIELAYRRNIDPVKTMSIVEYKKYFTTIF